MKKRVCDAYIAMPTSLLRWNSVKDERLDGRGFDLKGSLI